MIEPDLGKLQSVHGIAPAFLQRAAIIVVLSFVFFLIMMIAFSIRQNIIYFLLATAFLIVQLVTLFGWVMQKRAEFKLFEKGFIYRNHICAFDEIESMSVRAAAAESSLAVASGRSKIDCEIKKTNGEKIILSEAIRDIQSIIETIRAKTGNSSEW